MKKLLFLSLLLVLPLTTKALSLPYDIKLDVNGNTGTVDLNGTKVTGTKNSDGSRDLNINGTEVEGTYGADGSRTLNVNGTVDLKGTVTPTTKTLEVKTQVAPVTNTNTVNIQATKGTDGTRTLNIDGANITGTYGADGTRTLNISGNTLQGTYGSGNDLLKLYSSGDNLTLKSSNGTVTVIKDENDEGKPVISITGTPAKLSIVAGQPETKKVVIDSVVSMDGDAKLMIQDKSDLDAYSELVVESKPNVKKVEFNNNSVVVEYKQKAKFLGIFGTYINGTISADTETKDVSIKLPWYSFLFKTENKPVESNIMSKISASSGDKKVSVESNGNTMTIQSQKSAKTAGLIITSI